MIPISVKEDRSGNLDELDLADKAKVYVIVLGYLAQEQIRYAEHSDQHTRVQDTVDLRLS